MKIFGLTNSIILILVILTMSIIPTPGNCKEPSSTKKEEISNIFFMPSTGQIGCSYYSDYWKKDRGKIRFFSIEGGKEINLILFDPRETANLIASSHDGKLIVVASFVWGELNLSGHRNVGIGCYSPSESKWLWRTNWPDWEETRKDFIEDVIFTPDDKKIIAVGNRSVFIYDARTGDVLKRWRDPFKDYPYERSIPIEVALSANGRYLVIWQEFHPWHLNDFLRWFIVNREVTVWDVELYKLVARWKRPRTLYWGGYLSDEVIFGSGDGYIRIWSISEQKMKRKWKAHWGREGYDRYAYSSCLMALTVSQDGKYIATKGFGLDRHGEQDSVKNVIKIWNLETGKFIHEFTGIEYGSIGKYRMVFSPDSRYFAFDKQGQLCLYETQNWQEKWCVSFPPEHKN